MNLFRTILITLLVTAASLGALFIPLNISDSATQPRSATGATISLVDSLPSVKAYIPSIPEQPKATTVKAETEDPTATKPSPAVKEPLPLSDKGIAPMEVIVEPEVNLDADNKTPSSPDSKPFPMVTEDSAQDTPMQEEPATATDASLASVAVSAVSPDPLPSLVDGYYKATSVDHGPSFNRTTLASRIKYPSLAKRQGREGLVMLRLFISSTGKVERIEVEEDPGYGLAEAAVRAFTDLQGEPAILEGKAVAVTLRYPVRFTLK